MVPEQFNEGSPSYLREPSPRSSKGGIPTPETLGLETKTVEEVKSEQPQTEEKRLELKGERRMFWEGEEVQLPEGSIGSQFQTILAGRKRPKETFEQPIVEAKGLKATSQLERIATKILSPAGIISVSDLLHLTSDELHKKTNLKVKDQVTLGQGLYSYFEDLRIIPEQRLLAAVFRGKMNSSPLPAEKEEELKRATYEAIATLTPREQKVILLRFGLEDGKRRTLEEIDREFLVTRETIRRIEAKALRKLRHPSRSGLIRNFQTYPEGSAAVDIFGYVTLVELQDFPNLSFDELSFSQATLDMLNNLAGYPSVVRNLLTISRDELVSVLGVQGYEKLKKALMKLKGQRATNQN